MELNVNLTLSESKYKLSVIFYDLNKYIIGILATPHV